MGLRQDAILIARNLGPAELLEYDKRRLKGVILEEGSLTAHVVIVARAMGIPVLGRVKSCAGKCARAIRCCWMPIRRWPLCAHARHGDRL
jgi:signal transduction protein with GAF and PtsI domain